MFLSEDRVLDVSVGTAQVRLANLIRDGWLSGASDAAYQHGMDHLLRVGPLGNLPGTSRLVRIWFVDPLYRDDTMTVGLRWETVGRTAGLFPVLDADIRLSAEDAQRTRVTLTGCYRPPFGALGTGLDKVLMRRVATITIGSLVTRLADALQGTVPATEAAESWVRHDAGPQAAFELGTKDVPRAGRCHGSISSSGGRRAVA
jgi:hypothetical protein